MGDKLFLVELNGASLRMLSIESIEDILSKNEPYYLEIFKADEKGIFTRHKVETRYELDITMKMWGLSYE